MDQLEKIYSYTVDVLEKIYSLVHLPLWALMLAIVFILVSPVMWRDNWHKND
jgi:hypothetical protein